MRRVESVQPPFFSDGHNIGKMRKRMLVSQINFDQFESERSPVAGAFGRVPVEQSWEATFGRTVKVRTWHPQTGKASYARLPWNESWSREGLESLVASAMIDFVQKAGEIFTTWNGEAAYTQPLPHNLAKGPWLHMPRMLGGRPAYHERKFEEGGMEYVQRAARFAGWLRGAAEFPRLARAIAHCVSPRGQNSYRTHVNLWDLALATKSPGRADRQFAAVRAAANTHLAAYGLRVQWGEVAKAVIRHPTRVNRGALKAAAATINAQVEYLCGTKLSGRYLDVLKKARGLARALKAPIAHLAWSVDAVEGCKFASLREALPAASEQLVFDKTDGVELWVGPDTTIRKDGVYVTRGWSVNAARVEGPSYLVKGSGRTYHSSYAYSWERAMEEALYAWAEQRRLEMKEVDLVSFLRGGSGFIPIVYRRDSYRAGNCHVGTESWVSGRGWGSKLWIPGHLLVPFLADVRVRNVATLLREQLAA